MADIHKDIFSEEENLLHEIQDQCSHFSDESITLVVKRTIRIINSWPVFVLPNADDYPNTFTTFDILSCECQSKSWEEISPFLEDAIERSIASAYDSLSQKEKFFIEYSECFYNTRPLDSSEIDKLLRSRFVELLNEHWSNSKKIQKFQEKRIW